MKHIPNLLLSVVLLIVCVCAVQQSAWATSHFADGFFRSSGDPAVGGAYYFYGYETAAVGPGDDAFEKCLKLARETHVPMVLVWGKDSCRSCDRFVEALNYHKKTAYSGLVGRKLICAFFRGTDAPGPKAVKAAHDFFVDNLAASKSACHLVGVYGVYENGDEYGESKTLSISMGTTGADYTQTKDNFFTTIDPWVKAFKDDYSNHLDRVTCAFEVKNTSGSRLEAIPGTKSVFVPFVRTKQFDKAETDWLEVRYPNGETVTNVFTWAANGPRRQEVEVAMTNAAGEAHWTKGGTIALALMSTQGRIGGKASAESAIHCVADDSGCADMPFPSGTKGPAELGWGAATLDGKVSSNKVWEANAYRQPGVGDEARILILSGEMNVTLSASNMNVTVRVSDSEDFLAELRKIRPDFRIEDCPCVTNELCWAAPETFSLSNVVTTVYTNDESALTNVLTAVPVTFAGATLTNGVYSVWPKDDGSFVTNEVDVSDVFTTNYTFTVTNVTVVALTNEEHSVVGERTVVTNWVADVPGGDLVWYTNLYYDVWAYIDEVGGLSTNATAQVDYVITNRAFCIVGGGSSTNEWSTDVFNQPTTFAVTVTNFIDLALSDSPTNVSNYGDVSSSNCTFETFDVYPSIASARYQVGANDGGCLSNEVHRSLMLRLTGGVVWDDRVVSFIEQVMRSEDFQELCALRQLSVVVCDLADPETGASLFTHAIAKNGRSGSSYLSRNGLAEGCVISPTGTAFRVELVRPDGSVAGELSRYEGKEDFDYENVRRIRELLDLAEDPREPENDVDCGKYVLAYGATADEQGVETNTLQMSDKVDAFTLVDVPANTPFTIGINAMPGKIGDECPVASVWRYTAAGRKTPVRVEPKDAEGGANVWWLTEKELQYGLFAEITAWTGASAQTSEYGGSTTFRYVPVVQAVSDKSGLIGFVPQSETAYEVAGEREIEIKVRRTGYTGSATATVSLDKSTTVPAGCISWANEGGSTNLIWSALEAGEKSIFVKVRDVLWGTEQSNLVFVVSASGAELDVGASTNVISILQEIDPDALTGKLGIVDPSVSETVYRRAESELTLSVERFSGWRTGVSTSPEARGEARAVLRTTGGDLSTNELVWSQYRVGRQTVTLKLPKGDASGKRNVTVTLSGTDCDGKSMAIATSNTVTICVVDAASPDFVPSSLSASVVQYVAFDYLAGIEQGKLDGWEPYSLEHISGDLPDGITAQMDATTSTGGIRFSGTPVRPTSGSCKATYWLRYRYQNENLYAYSMPFEITLEVKPLGESAPGKKDGVNPTFTEASRIWTDLPLTNGEGRLVGLLNLTTRKDGSVSAAYRKLGGKSVSFAASALTSVPPPDYTAVTDVSRTSGKLTYELHVNFATNGAVFAEVCDPEMGSRNGVDLPAGATAEADHLGGVYTVAFPHEGEWDERTFCTGVPVLRIKSGAATGKATYALSLPNGKSVSGSSTFTPMAPGADAARLPILYLSTLENFSALLGVVTNAGETVSTEKVFGIEGVTSIWDHVENGIPEASCVNAYGVVGTRFQAEDWAESWQADYGTDTLAFRCDCDDVPCSVRVRAGKTALSVANPGTVEDDGFLLGRIQLNPSTGVAAGVIRMKASPEAKNLSNVNWQGVALPGMPEFMMGSYWYNASVIFDVEVDGQKVERKRTIRMGGKVSVTSPAAE